MRQITEQSVAAFNANKSFKLANTIIDVDSKETKMYLHNNLIAVKDIESGRLKITNAGWQSNTTKERLNGLNGVSIYQKDFSWYLNDQPWDGQLITIK